MVFQDHPAVHPIQEWHFRGEPDQANPTRPDPARGDGHHQEHGQPRGQRRRGRKTFLENKFFDNFSIILIPGKPQENLADEEERASD